MTEAAKVEQDEKEADHHPYFRPKDAATLILVDRSTVTPKVLVGEGDGAARREGPWKPFGDAGLLPDPSGLFLIARAITPPGRVRRFDTRFFTADASAITHRAEGAG